MSFKSPKKRRANHKAKYRRFRAKGFRLYCQWVPNDLAARIRERALQYDTVQGVITVAAILKGLEVLRASEIIRAAQIYHERVNPHPRTTQFQPGNPVSCRRRAPNVEAV